MMILHAWKPWIWRLPSQWDCLVHLPALPNRACWPSSSTRLLSVAALSSSSRPTLDDVERLSRGEASKAKIGSRAVPHRLNADERKAYELAKKRGYLVRHARTRCYPLSNTFRNYCDALGWPCLRIDQGQAGNLDTVVVDLTTLRLQDEDFVALRAQICKTIDSSCLSLQDVNVSSKQSSSLPSKINDADVELTPSANREMLNKQCGTTRNEQIMEVVGDVDVSDQGDITAGLIHFYATRTEAKQMCQAARDCCKSFASIKTKKPLV